MFQRLALTGLSLLIGWDVYSYYGATHPRCSRCAAPYRRIECGERIRVDQPVDLVPMPWRYTWWDRFTGQGAWLCPRLDGFRLDGHGLDQRECSVYLVVPGRVSPSQAKPLLVRILSRFRTTP